MECVHAPIEGIQGICGEQVPDPRVPYVTSRHCVRVDCGDGMLLYHTLTGELLFLRADESPDVWHDELVRRRFLVPEGFDEYAYALQVHAVSRLLQPRTGEKTSFTIFTTTDCNARCPYCFERGIPRKTMTAQVAVDVADYIAQSSGGSEVTIHWFGGEPLLNVQAIDVIARGLRNRGVPLRSHMTSNGYYLDAQTAVRARELWNLEHVQITLDGTEERYNRTKSYVDARGSGFERVLSNIGAALDAGVRVYVRLNMDGRNVDDLHVVCDVLAQRFPRRDGLKVVVQPLVSLAAQVRGFESENQKYESFVGLVEHAEALGLAYNSALPDKLNTSYCMADACFAEVILPDGEVARCDHVDPSEHVGTIYDPWRDQEILASWAEEAEPLPQCRTCPLVARCNRLRRCAWRRAGCSSSKQRMRLYKLKKRILAAYKAYAEAGFGNVAGGDVPERMDGEDIWTS